MDPIPAISELQFLCATVYQEAAGESYDGKLAVAYVIMNRSRYRKQSITDVCLAPFQFSCWNTDSPTRSRLDKLNVDAWMECEEAVDAAYHATEPDPTKGADAYLNIDTVIRVSGKLPSWYQADLVTARIGAHTFLRLK